MTYITKNDRKHGTKSYRDVDAAAIKFTETAEVEREFHRVINLAVAYVKDHPDAIWW